VEWIDGCYFNVVGLPGLSAPQNADRAATSASGRHKGGGGHGRGMVAYFYYLD